MKQHIEKAETRELRSEIRKAAASGASIEFKPSESAMTYQFPLRDYAAFGLGVLAGTTSDIFNHIRVGDIFYMKFHKGDASLSPDHLRVEIRHISEPAGNTPNNYRIIGLSILERTDGDKAPASGYWQPV